MDRARRSRALLVGAVGVLLALAGCSGGGSAADAATAGRPAPSARAGEPAPSATAGGPTSSPAPSYSDAALLPGSRLRSLLLTGAQVPGGYHAVGAAARDTGEVFAAPGAAVPPPDAVSGCAALTSTGFLALTPGPAAASFAQNEFDGPAGRTISSEVDDYRAGDAARLLAAFRGLLGRCASFADPTDARTPTWQLAAQPGPAIGDESVAFVVTSDTYLGGETAVVVRVGDLLVAVFDSTDRDTGAQAGAYAASIAARAVAALHRATAPPA